MHDMYSLQRFANIFCSGPAAGDAGDERESGAVNTGTNLFVTGIHPRLSESDVSRMFSKYGEVESCSIMKDPHSQESRGFGFVKMMTPDQAEAAKEGLQGEMVEGRTLSIEKARRARPRTPTPGRYFGPPKKGESLAFLSSISLTRSQMTAGQAVDVSMTVAEATDAATTIVEMTATTTAMRIAVDTDVVMTMHIAAMSTVTHLAVTIVIREMIDVMTVVATATVVTLDTTETTTADTIVAPPPPPAETTDILVVGRYHAKISSGPSRCEY